MKNSHDLWVENILEEASEGAESRGGLLSLEPETLNDILDKFGFDALVIGVNDDMQYLAINVEALTEHQLVLIKYVILGTEV